MALPYKVGDKFIIMGDSSGYVHGIRIGSTVTMTKPRDNGSFYVNRKFAGGDTDTFVSVTDVKPVGKSSSVDDSEKWFLTDTTMAYAFFDGFETLPKTKKPLMKQLSSMMKRWLDADTQTLVKAGFINGDLELTDKGSDSLTDIIFAANKALMVTAAQAVLDAEAAASK